MRRELTLSCVRQVAAPALIASSEVGYSYTLLSLLPSVRLSVCLSVRQSVYNVRNMYTMFQKLVPQADIDNFVNSRRIFKIVPLAHSAGNLR